MADKEEKDIYIDVSGLKKNEKIVYEYDSKGRIRSVKKQDKDDCWVVTAYYGHPNDPHVCAIRDWRNELTMLPVIGGFVIFIDERYKKMGKTVFASWWRERLQTGEQNIQRRVTRLLCRLLLACSGNTTITTYRNREKRF